MIVGVAPRRAADTAPRRRLFVATGLVAFAIAFAPVDAQDRLAGMPGDDQFTRIQPVIAGAWGPQAPETSGAATNVAWSDDGRTVTYAASGKAYRFDVSTKAAVETGEATIGGARAAGRGGARGAGGQGQVPPTGRSGGMEPARVGRSGGMEQEQ